MTRLAMWVLLAVVAGAAAVLSFSALRDLAVLCGFSTTLSPLLPVVIDAGAAGGCLAWLSGGATGKAARFARALTVVLLASSVAGNAVVHGLTAYHLAPPWWLVVAVSAVAPAVLGAVVHLAVLTGRAVGSGDTPATAGNVDHRGAAALTSDAGGQQDELLAQARRLIVGSEGMYGRGRLAEALNVSEHRARQLLEQLSASNGTGAR